MGNQTKRENLKQGKRKKKITIGGNKSVTALSTVNVSSQILSEQKPEIERNKKKQVRFETSLKDKYY